MNVSIPRESGPEFVPVDVTITEDGSEVTVDVFFAVLLRDQRPTADDWSAAVADPSGGSAIGVVVDPVDDEATYGVWAKIGTGSLTTDVLDPSDVGFIYRT